MRTRYHLPVWGLFVLALLLPWVSGCDSGSLEEPEITNDTFRSYVALGNSITAGFQANGIVASTQSDSYANLLAQQMGTSFGLPLLNAPGCPPPVNDIFTDSFSQQDGGTECALRAAPAPSTVNNVAVPGAQVFDALSNVDPTPGQPEQPVTSTNALTQFVLGGRTQVQAARQANPTFATVWLGNNDLLGAALAGVPDTTNANPSDDLDNFPAPSTPPSLFEQQYRSVIDSLTEAGVQRGVLIAVANPTLVPNLSPGQAFAAAEGQINSLGQALASDLGAAWGSFETQNCATGAGANVRVPLSYFFGTILRNALQGSTSTLNCNPNPQSDPSNAAEPILTQAEQSAISARLTAYNDIIESVADDKGWVYVDEVNPALQNLYQAGTGDGDPTNDLVPKLPTPSENSPTFGRYFSEDGVHPSSTTHRVVAHLVIRELNAAYDDVQLEQVSIPDEVQPLLP